MIKNTDCKSEAMATALLAKYVEIYSQKVALDAQLSELREKAVRDLCIYEVGTEFIDGKGTRFVLTKIEASASCMSGIFSQPCLSFNYTFRKVRKDGGLSLNNSYVDLATATPTGKIWDFKTNV